MIRVIMPQIASVRNRSREYMSVSNAMIPGKSPTRSTTTSSQKVNTAMPRGIVAKKTRMKVHKFSKPLQNGTQAMAAGTVSRLSSESQGRWKNVPSADRAMGDRSNALRSFFK